MVCSFVVPTAVEVVVAPADFFAPRLLLLPVPMFRFLLMVR